MSSILKIEFEKLRKTKSFWAIMLFLVFITSTVGMKQRLGIAAAIMEHPDIILIDEPTNALDSKGVEMVKCILQQEKERGALIVLTCHDYSVLKELSDSIYFIEEGRVVGYERQ